MASILATYNITKAVDANGVVVEPVVEFTDGLVRYVYLEPQWNAPLNLFQKSP